MKLNRLFILICFFIVPALPGIIAQNQYNTEVVTDTIPINFENKYFISKVSIIPFSEKIILRNTLLQPLRDFRFLYSEAAFTLSDSLPYSIFDTLYITYQTVKISLKKEYRKRSLVIKYDPERGDTIKVVELEGSGLTPESIFGEGMQKSGTLIRGFTVGTTKDFSLNSGLRLQLSGKLSEDIEVVAALTDQNTPIQPEGNTEQLEEIDKVFIQVQHPNATGTFGDYQLTNRNGEFGVINRKLQGLMGTGNYSDFSGYGAIASSRGKFNSVNFNGTDGVQGPYFLSGLSGEKDIIIIAGTEKVFLDGIEMIRGENNDYIIEYSNASITFTPGRLITDASRIVADFEYTDRRYARNFFGTSVSSKFFNDDLTIGFQYLREGDDEDAPIDISFTDEDLQAITDAGDDPLNAVKSGVTLVEPDSLGIRRGIYQAIDTLINNEPYTYYFYNPGDSLALYDVRFSYVGEGNGDYRRDALGQYSFAGIDLGGYLPVIFLPLPQLKELGNFTISMTPIEKVHIDMEYAGSLWDKNRLSDLDDSDNFGYAANINVRIDPMQIQLGSINFGKIGLGYKDRFINKKFTSTDRFNVVEFDRIYNTTGSPEEEDEQFREFRVNYIPIDEFTFQSLAGFLIRGDDFKTDRYRNSIKLSDNEIYNAYYDLDYVKSRNISISGNWLRQAGDASYLFWKIKPGINYLAEDKEDKRIGTDSLLSSSLKYYELSPYLQLIELEGINLIAKYSLRDDFLPLNGLMEMEASSQAQIYEMNYRGIKEVTTTLNLTLRDKKFKEAFKQQGFLDIEQILIRSQSRFNFWEPILNGDLFYEVSTQKQARLQKVFVRVEKGTGNYRYVGDINENGIADDFEFESTLFDGDFALVTIPTDELFPVIDLKTSTRWKINYEKIFDENTLIGSVLQPLSTETSWRIEEITKEEDLSKIYLLQLKYFQDDSVTIRGANFFLQDIFINENQQDLSFRLRYSQRISMSDFNTGIEKGYNRERSIRIRFRMVKEINNQTDVVNITDNVSAPQPSAQNRQITDNSIASDFSYRPDKNIEIGFKLKVGRSEDDFPAEPTIIDLNSELIRINLSFAGTGRLSIELERTELLANTTQNFLPYELTAGNQLGKNYFWRLNFDYRLASFLQTTVSYDGRLQGSSKVVHTARAEARAYF